MKHPAAGPRGRYRAELHCHVDGSVRPETVVDLAKDAGLALAQPVRELVVAPPDVGSLHGFLPYIDVPLQVLQTPQSLERAARELVEDWHADGVTYGEARFAPQLHTRLGMTLDDAIRAVATGLRAGSDATGVASALIVCCLRHQPVQTSLQVVDAAVRAAGLVAGVDLAGDERLPGTPHREAFDLAHAAGLPVTVHAGEAAGPESVWEALDVLGARRIGHGVRSGADRTLLDRLAKDQIALEMCPRCNVLTQAVPSMAQHPAAELLALGLAVTISTDTRTTADTTLGSEFEALGRTFGWGPAEHDLVQANAHAAAFGSTKERPGAAGTGTTTGPQENPATGARP